MPPWRPVAAAILLLSIPAVTRAQDRIQLADGTEVEGRVVYEDERELIVRHSSRERSLRIEEVKSVRSLARSLREALDHWDRVAPDDAAGIWELALFCRDRGLDGEAALFAWLVVLQEPDHERARALLGHERRGDSWRIKDGQNWLSPEQLSKKRRAFADGWAFDTLHYRVRTNLPLPEALAVALDLERFYRFFFESFGRELRLFDVTEPMHAEIHADARGYPDLGDGRIGYFDGQIDTLFVLAEEALDPQTLYHEATHQIVHDTAERHAKALGAVPAWIHEGWATYMESSSSGAGGHATFELGKPVRPWFGEHASARKPYDLPGMFSLQSEDFMIRSKAGQKYAQAYTLVHYCMHGEGEKFRPGFLEYLRSVYQGQSSVTDFRKAMKVSEKKFEEGWHVYAASLAP